ncbi:hypothetical protein BpHYR1_054482 [Brachionus plicatilis]|uniref:Uncharacterized protein n=1 Tax=Brachionus plicatilis TaxID=10195 RepID=A0A3M7Q0I5_BRAPC|nr:hypothetical protein BpHYR1_054482 [Brachionus plicatilis]
MKKYNLLKIRKYLIIFLCRVSLKKQYKENKILNSIIKYYKNASNVCGNNKNTNKNTKTISKT